MRKIIIQPDPEAPLSVIVRPLNLPKEFLENQLAPVKTPGIIISKPVEMLQPVGK